MKKYIAECIGTCILVLFGCGVAVLTSNTVGIALAFGLVVVAMAYSIGNVSGCHINPAVSVGMAFAGKMEWKECAKYVIAQVVGAIIGAALLGYFLGSFETLGANYYDTRLLDGDILKSLLVEATLTFVFVLTILGVTDRKENGHITGLIIGLTLTLVHLIGIPFTGTSVNPARSLGPAIFEGSEALSQVWLFIIAPLIGALIASIIYKKLLK